jgi:hypothetical protein
MNTYEIPVTLFVQAANKADALSKAMEEMDFLCNLDNPMVAVAYPKKEEIKRSES